MEAEVIGVNNRSVLRIDASRYADADGFNLLKIRSAPCGTRVSSISRISILYFMLFSFSVIGISLILRCL